jgi:hypothetical protein
MARPVAKICIRMLHVLEILGNVQTFFDMLSYLYLQKEGLFALNQNNLIGHGVGGDNM